MRQPSHTLTMVGRATLAIATVLAWSTASFAQVHVIISGGFSAAYREVLPEFERTTGLKVETTTGGSVGNGPNTIGAQLRRGVAADVVILSREGAQRAHGREQNCHRNRHRPGSESARRRRACRGAKPDLSTVESVKQTLLRAKSVTFTSSTSGVYLMTILFPRLGIADEMAKKTTTVGVASVVKGEAEMAIQPVSELLPVTGVDFVGTIPAAIQKVNVYAAAVVAGSKDIDASKKLIRLPCIGRRNGGDEEERDGAVETALIEDARGSLQRFSRACRASSGSH